MGGSFITQLGYSFSLMKMYRKIYIYETYNFL